MPDPLRVRQRSPVLAVDRAGVAVTAFETTAERGGFGAAPTEPERPLAAYGVLMSSFLLLTAGFGGWLRASGLELPERVDAGDLILITVATHKSSRLITRDRVTSSLRAPFTRFQRDSGHGEVDEAARGRGLRRAVGELLVCPYCIGMWIGAGFIGGLIAAPRTTRWIAACFAVLAGSDALQIAYAKGAAEL